MNYRVFILFFLSIACNDIKDCDLDVQRTYALVTFYDVSDSTIRDTLRFNSVYSEQSPYVFINDTILGTMPLFLDPNEKLVTYQLETDSIDYDLTFKYQTEVSVYSVECGPSIKFDHLEITSSTFDSIAITNPVLNNDLLNNAKIYF